MRIRIGNQHKKSFLGRRSRGVLSCSPEGEGVALVVIVALAVLVVLGTAGHRGFSVILGKYAEGTTDCGGYSPSGIIRIIFGITNKQRKKNYPKEHSADFLPDDYHVSVEINNTLISR